MHSAAINFVFPFPEYNLLIRWITIRLVLQADALEEMWLTMASEISTCLVNQITLPEEDHPIPFDAASDISIDDQKYACFSQSSFPRRNPDF